MVQSLRFFWSLSKSLWSKKSLKQKVFEKSLWSKKSLKKVFEAKSLWSKKSLKKSLKQKVFKVKSLWIWNVVQIYYTFWRLILIIWTIFYLLETKNIIYWHKVYIIETINSLNVTIFNTVETLFYSCETIDRFNETNSTSWVKHWILLKHLCFFWMK